MLVGWMDNWCVGWFVGCCGFFWFVTGFVGWMFGFWQVVSLVCWLMVCM